MHVNHRITSTRFIDKRCPRLIIDHPDAVWVHKRVYVAGTLGSIILLATHKQEHFLSSTIYAIMFSPWLTASSAGHCWLTSTWTTRNTRHAWQKPTPMCQQSNLHLAAPAARLLFMLLEIKLAYIHTSPYKPCIQWSLQGGLGPLIQAGCAWIGWHAMWLQTPISRLKSTYLGPLSDPSPCTCASSTTSQWHHSDQRLPLPTYAIHTHHLTLARRCMHDDEQQQ